MADTLLDHAESALVFAAAGVDERLVSWNRLVLLHGPPGTGLFVVSVLAAPPDKTVPYYFSVPLYLINILLLLASAGKTSLCRALAQKLAIRLSATYPTSQLLEINSHSLFSKWFSESGKLVMKLFERIRDLLEDDGTFVTILIGAPEYLLFVLPFSVSFCVYFIRFCCLFSFSKLVPFVSSYLMG